MEYLSLFESWHEAGEFPIYNKHLRLFRLSLAPTPFKNPDSAAFAEIFGELSNRLAEMNMKVEIERKDPYVGEISEWITLEVEAHNSEGQPVYLRFMLMPNSQNPEEVYVITANHIKTKSIHKPAEIVDSILELTNKILVPAINDPDYPSKKGDFGRRV